MHADHGEGGVVNPQESALKCASGSTRANKILVAAALFLVLLAVIGRIYEVISEHRAAANCPVQGKLVDVGGYRLHLSCLGVGSPTVILESGALDSSRQWDRVQAEVAKTTRVCSYDRAGFGWSDPGPEPRTSRQMAVELHTPLTKSGVNSPYVLVGHSFGGLNVRLFAELYPTEVGGMVLELRSSGRNCEVC